MKACISHCFCFVLFFQFLPVSVAKNLENEPTQVLTQLHFLFYYYYTIAMVYKSLIKCHSNNYGEATVPAFYLCFISNSKEVKKARLKKLVKTWAMYLLK